MLAARVEQKNGMTKDAKNGAMRRMRESRSYGSVRGALSNERHYRELIKELFLFFFFDLVTIDLENR